MLDRPGEPLQIRRPPPRDTVTKSPPRGSVPIQGGMLEDNARGAIVKRLKSNVDPTRLGVRAEVAVHAPRQRNVSRWLPGEDHAPLALAVVDAELVPTSADTRLEDGDRHIDLADVVLAWPPRIDAFREDVKGMLDGRFDVDRETDGRLIGGLARGDACGLLVRIGLGHGSIG